MPSTAHASRRSVMTPALPLIGALALAMLLPAPPAQAEIVDVPTPPDGCLGSVSEALGLTDADATQHTTLDIDGPVQQVVIEWSGIWQPAPLDPTISVAVTGASATLTDTFAGTEVIDATGLPLTPPSTVYSYSADITDLFGSGAPGIYAVDITPPVDSIDTGENRWYGATVTAIYDDSPCDVVETALWKTGADFYFGGGASTSPTTDLLVYDWGYPLAEDYNATLVMSHGGADRLTSDCRASSIWVATGSGTAPVESDDVVDDTGAPTTGRSPVEAVVMPWTPPNQPCPGAALTPPATAIEGGSVGAEWGLVELDVLIPAGATWAAFQLESPRDNAGYPGAPMAGTWVSSLLIVPQLLPQVALEKTVVDGGGSCPGVEGTDELVSGEAGTAVTYCYRVINSGQVALGTVAIDDPGLGIDSGDLSLVSGDDTVPLPPGAELVYSYATTIIRDLASTATVTAVRSTGTDEVSASNAAAVEVYTIAATVSAFCLDDAPHLAYDITTNAPGSTASITFTGAGGSESFGVDMPGGVLLWPGAEVGPDGTGTDWPGWDQDADGNWFENPANSYAWARGDLEITVTVNPTTEPVTVAYPPSTADCLTAPPPSELPTPAPAEPTGPTGQPASPTPPPAAEPSLPSTGSDAVAPTGVAVMLAMLGAVCVALARRRVR